MVWLGGRGSAALIVFVVVQATSRRRSSDGVAPETTEQCTACHRPGRSTTVPQPTTGRLGARPVGDGAGLVPTLVVTSCRCTRMGLGTRRAASRTAGLLARATTVRLGRSARPPMRRRQQNVHNAMSASPTSTTGGSTADSGSPTTEGQMETPSVEGLARQPVTALERRRGRTRRVHLGTTQVTIVTSPSIATSGGRHRHDSHRWGPVPAAQLMCKVLAGGSSRTTARWSVAPVSRTGNGRSGSRHAWTRVAWR